MNNSSDLRCPECGYKGVWQTYFCPNCENHSDSLYREEHRERDRAKKMNRADIIQEYRLAGIPFRAGVARV